MNYKRIQRCPRQNLNEDCQPSAKKPRVENELDFNDPPSFVFNKLKIPRRVENRDSSYIPLMNDTVSPILPPFPGFEKSFRNVEDPVTKAVIDNITGKLDANMKAPKLKYYRCKECDLTLSGQATLDDHNAGARHARKLKELEIRSGNIDDLKENKVKKLDENKFKCRLCDVKAESLIMIKSHIDGSKHKKKLQAYREEKSKKHRTSEESSIPDDNKSPSVCQGKNVPKTTVTCSEKSSALKLSENICSNDKSTAGKPEPDRPFYCYICSLCMNSQQQYDQHVNSKKHSAKVIKQGLAKNEDVPETIVISPDKKS